MISEFLKDSIMNQADKDQLKIKIKEQIIQRGKEIEELEELTKPISPENSIGRVSRMDAINNKSVAEAALRTKKKKLASLKNALTKIDLPDFGKCERCKNPIQIARVIYMPESGLCVHCAAK